MKKKHHSGPRDRRGGGRNAGAPNRPHGGGHGGGGHSGGGHGGGRPHGQRRHGGGGQHRQGPREAKVCPMCGAVVTDLRSHINAKHDDTRSHPID